MSDQHSCPLTAQILAAALKGQTVSFSYSEFGKALVIRHRKVIGKAKYFHEEFVGLTELEQLRETPLPLIVQQFSDEIEAYVAEHPPEQVEAESKEGKTA